MAFAVKVLAMADKLVGVQRSAVCDGVRFLMSRAQDAEGLFREVGPVSYSAMMVRALPALQHVHSRGCSCVCAGLCVCVCVG